MAQAKTLSDQELQRVLDYAATTKAAVRNRAILLLTHWAGMRIGEVAKSVEALNRAQASD